MKNHTLQPCEIYLHDLQRNYHPARRIKTAYTVKPHGLIPSPVGFLAQVPPIEGPGYVWVAFNASRQLLAGQFTTRTAAFNYLINGVK